MNAVTKPLHTQKPSTQVVRMRLCDLMLARDEGRLVQRGHQQFLVVEGQLKPVAIEFGSAA